MPQDGPSESGYHFIQDYRKCKKYFEYAYIIGLEPVHKSPTLIYGGAVHYALERYYITLRDKKSPDLANKAMLAGFRKAMTEAKDLYVKPDFWTADLARGLNLLGNYPIWYANEGLQIIAVEQSLWMPISDVERLTGRIDLVVRNSQDRIYIMDHKTTGWSMKNLVKTLQAGDQPTAYVALWNYNHPDLRAQGAIFNILREYQGSASTHRELVYRTQRDIDEFLEGIAYDMNELQQRLMDPDARWGKNTESCFLYNRPCPFLELCNGVNYDALIGIRFKLKDQRED